MPRAGPPGRLGSRLMVLTDRRACLRPLAEVVRAAVDGGARAVVLREKDLPAAERARLADELRAVLAGGLLVLAGAAPDPAPHLPAPAPHLPAPALHLSAPALHLSASEPVPAPRPALLGRSCHSAAELRKAGAERCDWVTLSPVWPTASKPGYGPALGLDGLAGLLAGAVPAGANAGAGARAGAPPAYALGGVDSPERARRCRQAGAYGVAVLGAVMRAARPDRAVAALLQALDDA